MKTITVTQEDIANGVPRSITKCPVALAMSRELGKTMAVSAHGKDTYGFQKWVQDFDAGMPVEPFTFEIPDDWEDAVKEKIQRDPLAFLWFNR